MTGAPIFIAFVLLDTLVLWLLVASGGKHWLPKVAAIVVVFAFNFAVWSSLGTYRGWPVTSTVPSKAFFISALIDQPSEVSNDPGHIDLWLIPENPSKSLLGYNPSLYEPRAYREPFSSELERAVIRAQFLQKESHGQPVVMRKTRSSGKRGKLGPNGHVIKHSQFRSYVLPAQVPSSKRGN